MLREITCYKDMNLELLPEIMNQVKRWEAKKSLERTLAESHEDEPIEAISQDSDEESAFDLTSLIKQLDETEAQVASSEESEINSSNLEDIPQTPLTDPSDIEAPIEEVEQTSVDTGKHEKLGLGAILKPFSRKKDKKSKSKKIAPILFDEGVNEREDLSSEEAPMEESQIEDDSFLDFSITEQTKPIKKDKMVPLTPSNLQYIDRVKGEGTFNIQQLGNYQYRSVDNNANAK